MHEQNNIRNWASELDTQTLLQAERSARSPAVCGPIALMPDAHLGIGATVGSVIPTKNAIIPSAVGVDIGCGMIAAELKLTSKDLPDSLDELHSIISSNIPAGMGKGNLLTNTSAEYWMSQNINESVEGKLASRAFHQLGSLGSGNHFLELCLDENQNVWIVLHSGSRGVGNQLASKHIKLAHQQNQALEDRDLAYFLEGTKEFQEYIKDMLWAQEYAYKNRLMMCEESLRQLCWFLKRDIQVTQTINCHHNFAAQEVHEDLTGTPQLIWITRKGAIRAQEGGFGVIPGSMGTCSYIVEGKGVTASYNSCSHGAGRKMSRTQAKKQFTVESLEELMKGKSWNKNSQDLLDEHPYAYKDIDQVMKDQEDLVKVVHTLSQVLNYKGA